MLVQLRRLPFKYSPKMFMTSKQEGYVYSDNYMTLVHVGCDLKVPDNWFKLVLVERFGPNLVLEHNFVSLQDIREPNPILYPISVKIYESDRSRTLIFKDGIRAFLVDGGQLSSASKSSFVTTEIKTGLAIELAKESDYGIDDITNYLVATRESVGGSFNVNRGYELPCVKDENTTESYPFLDTSLTPPHTGIVADLRTSAVNLVESAYQRNHIGNHRYDWSPISYIDENYDDEPGYECDRINYGNLARMCIFAENIRLSQALSCCGTRSIKEQAYTLRTEYDDYVPLTKFVSSVMNIVLWVQHSPFLEVALKYILPKRGVPEGFQINNVILRTATRPRFEEIPADLHRLTADWDPDLSSLEIVKVDTDEMFLTINTYSGTTYKYYIDVTVATILTQELIHS